MSKKTQTQDVPEDLPKGTFVVISDKPNSICLVEKTTPNGMVFMEYATWYGTKRFFRYRHSVHEMTMLSTSDALNYAIRSLSYDLQRRRDFRAPVGLRILQRFRKIWGEGGLAAYLHNCGAELFRAQDLKLLIKDVQHRRLLATKAQNTLVRGAFGGKPPVSRALH